MARPMQDIGWMDFMIAEVRAALCFLLGSDRGRPWPGSPDSWAGGGGWKSGPEEITSMNTRNGLVARRWLIPSDAGGSKGSLL